MVQTRRFLRVRSHYEVIMPMTIPLTNCSLLAVGLVIVAARIESEEA